MSMIFASSLCKIFETCIPKTAIKSHVTSYYSLLMIIQVIDFCFVCKYKSWNAAFRKLPLKSTVSPCTFVLEPPKDCSVSSQRRRLHMWYKNARALQQTWTIFDVNPSRVKTRYQTLTVTILSYWSKEHLHMCIRNEKYTEILGYLLVKFGSTISRDFLWVGIFGFWKGGTIIFLAP